MLGFMLELLKGVSLNAKKQNVCGGQLCLKSVQRCKQLHIHVARHEMRQRCVELKMFQLEKTDA